VQVVLLTDTHVADGSGRQLDQRVWSAVEQADLVLHAGDVTGAELLEQLGAVAPVHAVLGNNDRDLQQVLPERLELELDGVQVAMVHDGGARNGRPARLARWFPSADLVVFGHSHLPEDSSGPGGQRIFNPGSCTQRRRAPTRTFGVLQLDAGRITELRHVHLD